LTQMNNLRLGMNMLSGTLPSSLGSLSQLQYLYLPLNNLSGTLPALPPRLWALNVIHSGLCGPVPFPAADGLASNGLDIPSCPSPPPPAPPTPPPTPPGPPGPPPPPPNPSPPPSPPPPSPPPPLPSPPPSPLPSPPLPPTPPPTPPFPGRGVFTCCSGQSSCGGYVNDPVPCSVLGDLYYATNGPYWTLPNGGIASWKAAAAGTPTSYTALWGTDATSFMYVPG
jgi:hypothetical protein